MQYFTAVCELILAWLGVTCQVDEDNSYRDTGWAVHLGECYLAKKKHTTSPVLNCSLLTVQSKYTIPWETNSLIHQFSDSRLGMSQAYLQLHE